MNNATETAAAVTPSDISDAQSIIFWARKEGKSTMVVPMTANFRGSMQNLVLRYASRRYTLVSWTDSGVEYEVASGNSREALVFVSQARADVRVTDRRGR